MCVYRGCVNRVCVYRVCVCVCTVLPDKVVWQHVTADPHDLQHVIADLEQELGVRRKGFWVGVATFVCAELQEHCQEIL